LLKKIIIVILLFVLIPSVYAEITDSTEFGSIQVDNEIYEITSGEQTMIKAWGTINEIRGGAKLTLMVILPDGLTDGLHTIPTSDGYFETFWMVDEKSQLGQYRITASYESTPLGEVTFEIREKIFSEQELLTARQLLDQSNNNTEITIIEDEPETPIPPVEIEDEPETLTQSVEIEENILFNQGLEKFDQKKYSDALILLKGALVNEPYNLEIKNLIQKIEKIIHLENKCDDISFHSSSDYDLYSECCDLKPIRERHACKQEFIYQKNEFIKEQSSSIKINTIKQENNIVTPKDEPKTPVNDIEISKNDQEIIIDKNITPKNNSFVIYLILGVIVLVIVILYLKTKKRSIPSFVITTSHSPKQQLDNEIKWDGI
jgi:hypothetical protein